MKKVIMLFALGISLMGQAQDTLPPVKWKHNFQTGINLTQSTFSQNWKGGGVNSIAFGGFLNLLSKYEGRQWNMNSDLQLQLGYLDNGKQTNKSSDRIFYDFKAGYKISSKWDFFGSMNFQTQFAPGFLYGKKADGKDSMVSEFMAPAYLTSSIGLEYRPTTYMWGRFGIGTLRQTFVLNDYLSKAKMYGLEKAGDKLRNQAVLQMIWSFDKDIMKNINLKLRSTTLWDYIKFDKAGSAVQRFDLNLTMKVNKYINTNVQAVWLNDYDQDKDWQYSQVLALGILYSWTR